MEQYFPAIIGALFVLLVTVLGWIGARVHQKIDKLADVLSAELKSMNQKLGGIERDLRAELTNLDRRVTRVEEYHNVRCEQ